MSSSQYAGVGRSKPTTESKPRRTAHHELVKGSDSRELGDSNVEILAVQGNSTA
ncbi:hypothetical protein FA13DRAFT_1734133 [Coprinellus micaceus]|uniref:Uncharacterized protein n=1 Tax=Coprinellus micaceus TaxID=71717 RepID=A0A4Y7T6I8_COPMI|nr:hypothetical protein FA13DRAFT_1734133 [Coprinellus micaceus]